MISFGGNNRRYPARWYPDPNQPERWRYWDGTQWTTYVGLGVDTYDERVGAPGVMPVPPGTPLPVLPPGTVASKSASWMIKAVLVAVLIGFLVIGGVFAVIVSKIK